VLCALGPFTTVHGEGCEQLERLYREDAFLVQHLIPSLVKLYIDIEHTGSMGGGVCVRVYA